ncbi:keratin, type I cytoskeletal 18-like [Ptychodera flava]|uniref:keratin, type I cytoskeletal 18-like n=1 Tax=Ptychodera flava TaxID=63121 RepID=UPI00396A3126
MTRQREVYYARYETAVQECSLKEALQKVHNETIDISVLFKEERHEMKEFKILIKEELLKREVEGGKYVLAKLRALLLEYNQKFETELRKHEESVRYISVTQIAEINSELQEVRTKYGDLFEKHMNLSRYYEREKILRSDLERAMKTNELAFSERIAELKSGMSELLVFREKFLKCESAFSEYTRLLEMRIHSYERLLMSCKDEKTGAIENSKVLHMS